MWDELVGSIKLQREWSQQQMLEAEQDGSWRRQEAFHGYTQALNWVLGEIEIENWRRITSPADCTRRAK